MVNADPYFDPQMDDEERRRLRRLQAGDTGPVTAMPDTTPAPPRVGNIPMGGAGPDLGGVLPETTVDVGGLPIRYADFVAGQKDRFQYSPTYDTLDEGYKPQVQYMADGSQVLRDPVSGQEFIKAPGSDHFTAPDARSAVQAPNPADYQGDFVGWQRALARTGLLGTDNREAAWRAMGLTHDPLQGFNVGYGTAVSPWPEPTNLGNRSTLEGRAPAAPAPGPEAPPRVGNIGLRNNFALPAAQRPVNNAEAATAPPPEFGSYPDTGVRVGETRPIRNAFSAGREQAANVDLVGRALSGQAGQVGETAPNEQGATYPVLGTLYSASGQRGQLVQTGPGQFAVFDPDRGYIYDPENDPYWSRYFHPGERTFPSMRKAEGAPQGTPEQSFTRSGFGRGRFGLSSADVGSPGFEGGNAPPQGLRREGRTVETGYRAEQNTYETDADGNLWLVRPDGTRVPVRVRGYGNR